MSVVNKIPYIESLLGSLNSEQLNTIKTLLNSGAVRNQRSLFTEGKLITSADKNTPLRVDLELELGNIKSGILVYTDNHCALIAYNRFQNVILYKLKLSEYSYEKLEEECSIEEFRRVLGDLLGGGAGGELTPEALAAVLEGSESVVVDINETDDKVQVGLDQDILDFIIPKELAISDFEHDVGETSTVIVIKPGLLDADSAYDISLEIEGTGTHYGVALTTFPYNNSQCITTSLLTINGETKEVYATMDNDGQVNITVPYVMTPESEDTKIFVKRRF